jgi:hypothetical protein
VLRRPSDVLHERIPERRLPPENLENHHFKSARKEIATLY